MIPVLTPAESAALDAASSTPLEILVERAGAAVAREVLDLLGGAYGRRVVVLAGKGNNGADGRAAGRRLERRGVRVQVIEALDAPASLPPCDLVIDAAFGTGFRGDYQAPELGETPVLAVDIPSGVSGLTGEAAGRVLAATRTVTFAALKPGLLLREGRELAGEVVLADIGLPATSATGLVQQVDVAGWMRRRRLDGHKWDAAVLVVAGSPGMAGAAHLTAAAAQRSGAGMVRVGTPGAADDAVRPLESVGLDLPSTGWESALTGVERFGAMVIGPGIGRDTHTTHSIRGALEHVDLPTVVDADALVALGARLGREHRVRSADTVLTPHDGEYATLLGHAPGVDRIASVRELATASGSVALLKGSTTIVAHPEGEVRIVTTGDARLATAGTGDVLSGVIGALLAQGLTALDAASAAAWLHGRAAQHGPAAGLVASDLLDLLPTALSEVMS